MTRVQLIDDELAFSGTAPDGKARRTAISISTVRIALDGGNLSAAKVEQAIALTEDIVMPVLRQLSHSGKLLAVGKELADVVRLLHAEPGVPVPIAEIEHLFNQFADHACGSPVAWRQAVPASQVALGLIVLREVMHHGGFESVSLPADAR